MSVLNVFLENITRPTAEPPNTSASSIVNFHATTNFTAVSWDTSTDADGEAGVDIQAAGCVVAMNQRLWFFDVQTDVDGDVPEQGRWTEVNDFNRSETGNFLNLSGSHSRIMTAGVLLSQLIAVYREDRVHIIQNPGSPVAVPRGEYQPGIVGPYAWTEVPGGGHFYVAKSGFFVLTGGIPQPMGRDKLVEYYLATVNEQYYDNVHCWTDPFNEEIHVGFPTTSGVPDKGLVYNWATGVWSEDNQNAWVGFYRDRQQTGHTIYRGDDSGHVNQEGGTTDNGTAINPIIRLKSWTSLPMNRTEEGPGGFMDFPDTVQLNQLETDITETTPGDATIKIAGHDTGGETPSYTSYTLNDVDGWMPDAAIVPTTGRYISVQIEGFESISEAIFQWQPGATK